MLLLWSRRERLFELLDSWVEEVDEDNVVQVITNNASNYEAVDTYNLIRNFQLLMYVSDYIYYLFIVFNLCSEIVGKENVTFVLDTMCRTLS